jgi:hypothetical protein
MPVTKAKKTDSAPNDSTPQTGNQSRRKSPLDRNGDNRVNLEDLLIGLKQAFEWVVSWRGAMLLALAFTAFSAYVNVMSWIAVLATLGGMAPIAGVLTWGFIQMQELMPVLDDLNLDAAIAELTRITRAPHEIPNFKESVTPEGQDAIDKFQNRRKKNNRFNRFKRYAFYGLEFAVLIVGGAVFSPLGISWGAVLLSFVGMVGVELGLRQFSEAGEKLLSPEERELAQTIKNSAKRDTVRL